MLRSRGDASLGPEYERETFFFFLWREAKMIES